MRTTTLIALFGVAFMVIASVSAHKHHAKGKHGGDWTPPSINFAELAQNITNAFAGATASPDAIAFDVLPAMVKVALFHLIKFNVSEALAAGSNLKWASLSAETQNALKDKFVDLLKHSFHVNDDSNQTCKDNVETIGNTLNQIVLSSNVNVAAINASFPMPPCKCQGFGKGKGESKSSAKGGKGDSNGKGGKGGKGHGHGHGHGQWEAIHKDLEAIKKAGIQFEIADTCPIQSAFWKLHLAGIPCWNKKD